MRYVWPWFRGAAAAVQVHYDDWGILGHRHSKQQYAPSGIEYAVAGESSSSATGIDNHEFFSVKLLEFFIDEIKLKITQAIDLKPLPIFSC